MALTDEQKEKILEIVILKLRSGVSRIKTFADLKTFIDNISKANLLELIKSEIQKDITLHETNSSNEGAKVIELEVLKTTLDTDL